jgi:magnesium transporter
MTWVDLVSPPAEELRALQAKHKFHELDIEDCLSEHERPKVDEYEHYLFIVLHIPYRDPLSQRIEKDEVDIFIGHDYLITLHEGKLQVLRELWGRLEQSQTEREKLLNFSTGYFLYELIEHLFASVFQHVDDVNRERRTVEQFLFEVGVEEKTLHDILHLKRRIISLRNILIPQRAVIASLEIKHRKFSREDLTVYFQNIADAIERQIILTENAREVVDALQDSHMAWIGHRTRMTMRVLTALSVIVMPAMLLTSLYGMNVTLPFAKESWAFHAIMALTLLSFVVSYCYFLWKKWW